jgi:hypothetical protein
VKIDETVPDAYPSTQKITANKIIQITAIPQYGYKFVGWSGDSVDLIEAISVTMTCDKEFTANFVPLTYKISVFSSPPSGGEVILKPLQPSEGYPAGTNVTITAKPAHGFILKEWSGTALNTTDNTFIYVTYADKSITAVFIEKQSSPLGWIIGGVIAGIIVIGVLLYLFVFRKRPIT